MIRDNHFIPEIEVRMDWVAMLPVLCGLFSKIKVELVEHFQQSISVHAVGHRSLPDDLPAGRHASNYLFQVFTLPDVKRLP